jgi:sugar lactone lactonase YvrE
VQKLRPFAERLNAVLRPVRLGVAGFFALAALQVSGQTNPVIVSTLAGYATFGSQDGLAGTAKFLTAAGVAVDKSGNVYVADEYNHSIRKVSPSGFVTTYAGKLQTEGTNDGAGSLARFAFPEGVAVDSAGNVYVADTGNDTIREITTNGTVSTIAGQIDNPGSSDGPATNGASFSHPAALAIDSSNNIYIVDQGNSTIRKLASGHVSTLAGQVGSLGASNGFGTNAQFSGPFGIAVDKSGNIYVADTGTNLVRFITPAGLVSTIGTSADPAFDAPSGVVVDSSSNVYVTDSGNEVIRMISPGGTVSVYEGQLSSYGDGDGAFGSTAATFKSPWGIAIDTNGNLFVGDSGNGSIRKVTPGLTLSTIAGPDPSYGVEGPIDGSSFQARLFGPNGLAVDGASNVYVADLSDNCIRQIAPNGTVSTLAGSVDGSIGSADGTNTSSQFYYPSGLCVDKSTNIYVADYYNQTIRMITPDATHSNWVTTTIGGQPGVAAFNNGVGTNNTTFNYPAGIAVDAATNLYVADYENQVVRKMTKIGTNWSVTTYASGFGNPSGIAVDSSTNVYMTDVGSNIVFVISPAGAVTAFATNDSAIFDFPQGVTVDSLGDVFIGNTGANTILEITPGAKITTTIAGNVNLFGGADGQGSAALFEGPTGVALDSAGNVYIADYGNNTVRKGVPATAQVAELVLGTSPSGLPITLNGTNYPYTPQVFALKAGSTNTAIASPADGLILTNWTVNVSTNVVATTTNYTFTLPASKSVVANFTNGYTITVSASPANGGTVSGGGQFDAGTTNTVTASPNAGYVFVNWTTNGTQAATTTNYSFALNTNASPVANFALSSPQMKLFHGVTLVTNGQASPVSFGTVQQPAVGPILTFTVTNSGGQALNVTNIAVPSGYTLVTNAPASIAFSNSGTFSVQLNSGTPGTFNGSITITNNDPTNNPFTFAITGTVLAPAQQMEVYNGAALITNGQTAAVNFGSAQINTPGPIVTLTVTNSGGQTLNVTNVTAPSGFTVVTNAPATIAAGASGTFSVQLNTTVAGTNSGNVTITDNDPTNSPFTFAVSGTVVQLPPQMEVSQAGASVTNGQTNAVSFGSVQINLPGPILTFTITNSGELTLNLTNVSVPSGFTLVTNAPATIAPATNGNFSVRLNTSIAGTSSGNIVITNNDPTNNPFTFAITGTVFQPPEMTVFQGATLVTNGQTNAVSFGSVQVNLTGPILTFTVTNYGGQPLNLTNVTVPSGFTLVTNAPATIAAGSNGTFSVQLNTGVVGTSSGDITITNNDLTNNPYSFAITGTVTTPPEMDVFQGATLIPNGQATPVSFGSVQVHLTGPILTFTVTNYGGQPLDLTGIAVPAGFALVTNAPAAVAAGASGTFSVQLSSASVGTPSGNVVITNNDLTNNPYVFAVAGTVTPPPPQLGVEQGATAITNGQATAINFGSVAHGGTGPLLTFSVTNSGGQTLNLTNLAVPSGYTVVTNPPGSLAPQSNGTFAVQLDSTTLGVNAGNITITNNDPTNNPFVFPITGTVTTNPPAMTVLADSTIVSNGQVAPVVIGTVQVGQTSPTVTFTITNAGDLTLNLTNFSLPAGFTLTGGTPASVGAESTTTFTVQLNNGSVGTFSGNVTITNNDPVNNPYVFAITGTVNPLAPEIEVFNGTNLITNGDTTAVNFGNVQQGQTAPMITFLITNAGEQTLNISNVVMPTGFILLTNAPASIAAGTNGTFTVQLDSSTIANDSGNIVITNNDPTNGVFVFAVTGIVAAQAPQFELSLNGTSIANGQTNVVSFGSVQQPAAGPILTFTVTNPGALTLNLTNLSVPAGFVVVTNGPATIASGASGTFSVQLSSASVGTFSGNVTVTNSDPTNNPFVFPVTGTVIPPPPQMEVYQGATLLTNGDTAAVSFGSVHVTLPGTIVTFTVTNSGGLPLSVTNLSVPAGFTLVTNAPASIAAGSSGTFSVQLNTSAIGTNSGNISITNNDPTNSPYVFAVTGIVLPPPPQMEVHQGATLITNGQVAAVNIGSAQVHLTGPIVTFAVTNSGGQTLTLTNVNVPAGFTLVTNAPASIAPGSNGTFSVQLNTSAIGTNSGNITITNNDPTNNPFTFAITGTVVPPPPQMDVYQGATLLTNGDTTAVSFGSVHVTQTGTIVTFTITNSGGLTLNLTNLSVPAGFTIVTNEPATVAPSASGTFSVQLNTSTVGTFSGNIGITNNDPTNNPYVFAVTGTVLPPPPQIGIHQGATLITNGQVAAVNFGTVQVNLTGPILTFTVTNSGGQTLSLTNVAVPSGYALVTNAPASIAPAASGTFSVQLSSASVGTFNGNITITNNDPTNNPFSFPITGTVVPPPPQLGVFNGATRLTNNQVAAVNIGSAQVHLTGPIVTFTVTNSGGQTLNLTNAAVTGGFTLVTNPPASLAASTSGTFSVQLNTTAIGTNNGTVTITNNDPTNNPFKFPVTGTVTPPPPQMDVYNGATLITNGTTTAVSFGTVQQPTAGTILTFTVTNSGGQALNLTGVSVPSGFTVVSNAPASVAASASGAFSVQLNNTSVGTFSGNITVTNNDPTNNPYVFAITGTILPPPPQIGIFNGGTQITNGQATAVNFGNVQVDLPGPILTFTITNSGGQTLNLTNTTVTSGFTLVTNSPASLAPNASGTFSVQLNTSTVGATNGTITVTNNDPTNNPFKFPITGTVKPPPAQILVLTNGTVVTNGQTSPVGFGSVQEGQAGTIITFTITNAGGQTLSNNVTVPAGFLLVTPAPSLISAGGKGTFSVQLKTTVPGTNSGNVSIVNNVLGSSPYVFAIKGIVTPLPTPQIQVSLGATIITNGQAGAVNFGNILIDQTGPILSFTVSNIGGQPLDLTNITVPSGYTLNTNFPTNIAAGTNGTFSVGLNSNVAGTFAGNIVITNNDPNNNPFSFPVTGLVGVKVMSLGGNLDFGVVLVGSTAQSSLIISNSGNVAMNVSNVTFPNAVFTGAFSGAIPAGSSQSVTVTFTPTAPAYYSGLVSVSSDATGGASNIFIQGFGCNTNLVLTVLTNGEGKIAVTPNDSDKLVKAGAKLSFKATPATGWVFESWSGSSNSTKNPLAYTMDAPSIIQGTFILNPFTNLVGVYNGLFTNTSGVIDETSAGMLKTLSVTSKGTYSGTLLVNGTSHGFTGTFGVESLAQTNLLVFPAAKGGTVTLVMNLVSTNPAPQVVGTVTGDSWSSDLIADRATNVLPSQQYTLLIAPDTNASAPGGNGYATITNAIGSGKNVATASAKIAGALADGTVFSQSVPVSEDGYVPVYANLYAGKGLLLGWLNLTNTNGAVAWVHVNPKGLFPNEFTITNAIILSPWTNPPAGSSVPTNLTVLDISDGVATATNDYALVISNGNFKVGGTGPLLLTGSLNSKTGVLTLGFGKGAAKVSGTAVILLNGTNGGGYFLTRTNAGSILLQP